MKHVLRTIRISLSTFIILFIGQSLSGQVPTDIVGKIIDKKTKFAMSNVNILVEGTFNGTVTDNAGIFHLSLSDTGTVHLEVSRIGYRNKDINVHVSTETDSIFIELVEQALYIPRVIVTASRRKQDILESPVSVTVLSMRSVQDRSIIDLEEALASEVGINTINGQLNIRGSSGFAFGTGNRSLVLIDNVPVLGSAAGNMTWTMVPTSEIAQVEIVRSGGSTLYGSSAMGGVVNILTRMPSAKPETRIMVKNGFFSKPAYDQWSWRKKTGLFHTIQLSHSRQFGEHGAWFRFQERSSDGYSELDWEKSLNFTGKVKLNFNQHFSGSVFGNYYADETGLATQWKSPADPFEAPELDKENSISGNKTNINSFFNMILSPKQVIKIKGSYFGSNWENTTAQKDFSYEKRMFSEVQHSGSWSKKIHTTTGVVLNSSSIDAKIFGQHGSKSTAGYILLQSHVTRKITLLTGVRGEGYWVDSKQQDYTWAPQLALNWKQNDALSFRTSYSKGFRVPSIAELFASTQLNVFKVEPNPELQAETSVSSEVGMTMVLPGNGMIDFGTVDVALFNSKYNQLIEPTPDDRGIIHFENITDARITGLEFSGLVSFLNNMAVFQTAYTWLDPVEVDNKDNILDTLSYRFRHTLVTSGKFNIGPVAFILENRYSSRMDKVELFDENPETGEDKRVPVHVWNAGINGEIFSYGIQLRVNNLFQYYYTELDRNMAPERTIFLTLIKKF